MSKARASAPAPAPARPSALRSKRARWLVALFLAALASGAALWIAVHRVDWLGPLIANTLRSIVGVDAVAKLEDAVYAVEDRVNRTLRKNELPKTYWQVPADSDESGQSATPPSAPAASAASHEQPAAPEPPAFRPKDVGPMHKRWSAPGDGVWLPIRDPRRPEERPYMWKTLLHPDASRSWSEVFVVAIEVARVELQIMAGSSEPKSPEKDGKAYKRLARIPEADHDELLAAFNGGFMTEHGQYGMKVDGVVLVKPREKSCTIAAYKDGSLRIATWKRMRDGEADMLWYRQAPECMVEDGKLHPGLRGGSSLNWGATLDGETVIRRSAIGLSADRKVLYVAITNHTTARAIALSVQHAGASDIAQLDVNWSYPKFMLYEPGDAGPRRLAVALAPGFEFSPDEYIRKRSIRDFFYLVRREPN